MAKTRDTQPAAAEQDARDREQDLAREEMDRLEQGDSVPSNPADWPSGKAKFLTFGGDEDAYGDGPTSMLGPAGVELHTDGPPTIRGAKEESPNGTGPRTADGTTYHPPQRPAPKHKRFGFRRRAR